MKTLFNIVIIFFLFPIIIIGQPMIVDSGTTLKAGIYRDLNEFKFNSPSIPFDENKIIESSNGLVHIYYLNYSRSEIKEMDFPFGFCDGENVYIANGNAYPIHTISDTYYRLQNVGRYSYFETYVPLDEELIKSSRSEIIGCALDFNNGNKIILSKNQAKSIFKNDIELTNKLNACKYKSLCFESLIIQYSNKHTSEIIRGDFLLRSAELIYKTTSDTTFNSYYNRIIAYIKYPSIYSVILVEKKHINGQIKSIGLKSRHSKGESSEYYYTIGTWRYFNKKGNLKRIVNYDFKRRKHGTFTEYDKNGNMVTDLSFDHGKKLTRKKEHPHKKP